MEKLAPQLSYVALSFFVLTCLLIVPGVSMKMPKWALKVLVLFALSSAGLMGICSAILYIWQHYYR